MLFKFEVKIKIQDVNIGYSSLALSYLFFTANVTFFCYAKKNNVGSVITYLSKYYGWTSHLVNNDKSGCFLIRR